VTSLVAALAPRTRIIIQMASLFLIERGKNLLQNGILYYIQSPEITLEVRIYGDEKPTFLKKKGLTFKWLRIVRC